MKSKSLRDPGDASDPIGGAFLVREYGLELVQPLPVQSEVGSRRRTVYEAGHRREVYQESVRPGPSPAAHLTFTRLPFDALGDAARIPEFAAATKEWMTVIARDGVEAALRCT